MSEALSRDMAPPIISEAVIGLHRRRPRERRLNLPPMSCSDSPWNVDRMKGRNHARDYGPRDL
jgi:hypothetical protein